MPVYLAMRKFACIPKHQVSGIGMQQCGVQFWGTCGITVLSVNCEVV